MEAAKLACESNNKGNDMTNILLNRLIDLEVRVKYLEEENQKLIQTNKNNDEENLLYNISLYKIEWNILECKIKLYPEKIEEEKNESKASLINIYKQIIEFLYNNFSNDFISSLISLINQIYQSIA